MCMVRALHSSVLPKTVISSRITGVMADLKKISTEVEKREQQNQETHPYLEKPVKELTKRIPELKGIRPAVDQQVLPMILQKTASNVAQFFANMVDVIASAEITAREADTRITVGQGACPRQLSNSAEQRRGCSTFS